MAATEPVLRVVSDASSEERLVRGGDGRLSSVPGAVAHLARMDRAAIPGRQNLVTADADDPEDTLARIRAGDPAAFETVFRTYFNALAAFSFRYVRSRDVAAEVVQDVFLNTWRNRATCASSGNIKAYLFESVRNRSIDVLKRDAVAERWAEQSSHQRNEIEPPRADTALESSDLTRALDQALTTFPERRRQVFLLRFKEGLSYAEIADVMGTTTKTVENQISRALRSLREQLGPFAP